MPSTIVDLNNAFVYYLSAVRGFKFRDYLSVLNTEQIQITSTGQPTYTPPIDLGNLQGSPVVLTTSDFQNGSTAQDTVTFDTSQSHTASFSIQVTEGVKIGAQTKVTTSIPFFAQAEVDLSAEATLSSTQDISSSDTQTFSTNTQINVPANSQVKANLVINSLQYTGKVTSRALVSGRLQLNSPGSGSVGVPTLFRAIAQKPPATNAPFSLTDSKGNTFSFTNADAKRFTVTPAPGGQVTYPIAANISANFGAGQSVQVQQTGGNSGQMVSQATTTA